MGYGQIATRFALLWLSGLSLRVTILAVPPLLPLIVLDLHLSATQVGVLMAIPVALFALAALPGAFLIARIGPKAVLIGGLVVASSASAIRGVAPDVVSLYAATMIMGIGLAVTQTSMPTISRGWVPERIGLGTAVYTNGLVVGGVVPAWLTAATILPLVHGSWRLALVIWSTPLILTVLLLASMAPKDETIFQKDYGMFFPNWRSRSLWQVGLIFGAINSVFFALNAFMPIFLIQTGRVNLVAASLTALNLGQVAASVLMMILSRSIERARWPGVGAGVLMLVSLFGLVSTGGTSAVAFAGLLGLACGGSLVFGLMLPALVSSDREIGVTSAGMFTISYSTAVIVSILSGAASDFSGLVSAAFAPVTLCSIALVVLPLGLRFRERLP